MGDWDFKSNKYKVNNFIGIPEGFHRAEITNVQRKKFKKTKRYIITFKVAHYHGKIWYDLWTDSEDNLRNTWKWTAFFTSFEISNFDISNYKQWIGKKGAIRVKSDLIGCDPSVNWEQLTQEDEDNLYYTQVVVSCVFGKEKDSLPPWDETFVSTCFER